MRGAEAAEPRTAVLRLGAACAPVSQETACSSSSSERERERQRGQERLLPVVDNPSRSPHTCCGSRRWGPVCAQPGSSRNDARRLRLGPYRMDGNWMEGRRRQEVRMRNWNGGGGAEWGGKSLQNNSRHLHPSLYHLHHQPTNTLQEQGGYQGR